MHREPAQGSVLQRGGHIEALLKEELRRDLAGTPGSHAQAVALPTKKPE